ncbi:hypothetical protein FisN_21Hu026 [Fistulifera solaris]|uniref:Large ribosomal subunit protein uL29m n=1 Tax=Fistulifera solaris TaxID=1519565 RepID=A0A1Z5KBJ8_FISSO|nr:hypothetical protein FisN_21Hu026 [Fistulifera solaris]|eukprot:GAX23288.1 hypothetical protein FisN_21Hu026 [Fistulifera solaris]
MFSSFVIPRQRTVLAKVFTASMMPAQSTRTFTHATSICPMPLSEFRDPVSRQQRMNEPVGRSWSARELRRKSFDDLHKLWLVLYKENNMLLTEQQLSRRRGIIFPQPDRIQKVKKSLGAIRQVMGERKREKLSQMALQQMEEDDGGLDDKTTEKVAP